MKKTKLLILFFIFSFTILSGCSPQTDNQDSSMNASSIDANLDSTPVSIDEVKDLLKVEPIHYSFSNNNSSSMEMTVTNLSKTDITNATFLLAFISEDTTKSNNPFYLLTDDKNKRLSLKSGEEKSIVFTVPDGYLPEEYNPEYRRKSNQPVVTSLSIDGYIHAITQKNYFRIDKLISF
ncbi:hypothetical protein [Carnobacterium funditum]|uniref:hypothetical protein n=1 Tax=Carnobacterium funditum TaxID=2752 RepID=UPI00055329B0|nr:hypothetical protein [Carnobacterium funditum]